MDTSTQSNATSGIGDFLIRQFENWRQNRAAIEAKWLRNWNNFRSIVVDGDVWKVDEAKPDTWRSRTFVNVTRRTVMTFYSLVIDTLLAGGKVPFMLKPSPWDEMQLEDLDPMARAMVERDIDDAQRMIDQQLQDGQADRALMANTMSLGIYGETYAKRIIHDVIRTSYRPKGLQLPGISDVSRLPANFTPYEKVAEVRKAPRWIYASVWDIFRDLETDDLQAGAGVYHRQLVSPYWLRQRKGRPFYIDAAIDTILNNAQTSGSTKIPEQFQQSLPPGLRNVQYRQNTIRYREYWGRVPRVKAEEFEQHLLSSQGGEIPDLTSGINGFTEGYTGDDVEIMCCIADNEVVRYARSSPEERPFFRAVCQQHIDERDATGPADNVEDIQRAINGIVRAIEDNKKQSANVQMAVKERFIDGDYTSNKPGQRIQITDDCDDVRKAIQPIVIPDQGEQLVSLLAIFEKYLDLDSLIPKIQQGVEDKHQVTAFEIKEKLSMSGKYLGGAIRNIDEGLIEPIVSAFFDYNMNDPAVTKGKGNYIVKALGFSSFQDRVERINKLQQFLTLCLSDERLAAETKLRWLLEEMAKALDMEPDQAIKTIADKQAEQAANSSNPLVDAKLAEVNAKIGKLEAETAAIAQKAGIENERLALERAQAVNALTAATDAGKPPAAAPEPSVAQQPAAPPAVA